MKIIPLRSRSVNDTFHSLYPSPLCPHSSHTTQNMLLLLTRGKEIEIKCGEKKKKKHSMGEAFGSDVKERRREWARENIYDELSLENEWELLKDAGMSRAICVGGILFLTVSSEWFDGKCDMIFEYLPAINFFFANYLQLFYRFWKLLSTIYVITVDNLYKYKVNKSFLP